MKAMVKKVLGPVRRMVQPPAATLQERYPQYRIGKESYGPLEVLEWGEGTTLTVGAYCSIAPGVKVFLGGEHRSEWVTTFPFSVLWEKGAGIPGHPKTKGDVIIGNDVWLATESIVTSGVTIGDGAVVGARAVVTRDVPPYAMVGGNPAKVMKYRFPPEVIAALLRIRWWDWEKSRIEKALPALLSEDINAFIIGVDQGRY